MSIWKTPKKKKGKHNPPVAPNEVVECQHDFTDAEKLELGASLANIGNEIAADDNHQKQVAKDLKAQIEAKEAKRFLLQTRLANGYEQRPAECRVELDAPKGAKRYYRLTDDKLVKECAMTANDYQITMPIDPDMPPATEGFGTNFGDAMFGTEPKGDR